MLRHRAVPNVAAVLGITSDTAVQLGLLAVVAMVGLALLFARVLIGNFAKMCAVGLLVAGAIYVWSQRSELQACADRVRAEAAPGSTGPAVCTVSGVQFSVDLQH